MSGVLVHQFSEVNRQIACSPRLHSPFGPDIFALSLQMLVKLGTCFQVTDVACGHPLWASICCLLQGNLLKLRVTETFLCVGAKGTQLWLQLGWLRSPSAGCKTLTCCKTAGFSCCWGCQATFQEHSHIAFTLYSGLPRPLVEFGCQRNHLRVATLHCHCCPHLWWLGGSSPVQGASTSLSKLQTLRIQGSTQLWSPCSQTATSAEVGGCPLACSSLDLVTWAQM